MVKSRSGFTIVELLIVIVVIAILAAISVVAYTGVRQRATNSSIISTSGQVVKLVSAYIATTNTYPIASNGYGCIVPASSCTSGDISYAANATFNSNLATVGTLPSSTPDALSGYNGIVFNYSATRTFNGVTQPLVITYSLSGAGQRCGLSNVATGFWTTLTSSTTGVGFTAGTGEHTICVISIPGP